MAGNATARLLAGKFHWASVSSWTAHRSSIDEMLREMLAHEHGAVEAYRKLLALTEGLNVSLEEFARQMIRTEELDVAEIEKMLRMPGGARLPA